MATIEEQIKQIEDEVFKTQKNKATEHHIGKLKAKIAKLRAQIELNKSKSTGMGKGFYVKKSGDATVALVGFPSVGKSSLLNELTNSRSEVAEYQFTTLDVIPGLLEYKGAKIQVLDMPGIIKGASKGKGRGKEVIAAARNSDLVLLMGDIFNYRIDILQRELIDAGIRLDQKRPDITFTPSDKGGIIIRSTVKMTKMTEEQASEIVRAFGIVSGTIVLREDATQDRLVDFLAGNRVFIRSITVINKIDQAFRGVRRQIKDSVGVEFLELSVKDGTGIQELKDRIYDTLGFIRIYLKPQGGPADMDVPLVLLDGSTVKAVCEHLHRDFVELFRYASIWGPSAKYPGQAVGINHRLREGDVLTVIIKKKS
ncbi:MAG: GTP-binding protein [Candidatus Thermoplasmatota archaeon]|nr:GTP-binding protein [Candidatus Thermoplasmatota archaeon]